MMNVIDILRQEIKPIYFPHRKGEEIQIHTGYNRFIHKKDLIVNKHSQLGKMPCFHFNPSTIVSYQSCYAVQYDHS
jgi:hypothetical protein